MSQITDVSVFIPSGTDLEKAISQTTHMAIAAHQDDLEIMSYHGILACYDVPNKAYCGIVMTDGSGSARTGRYADFSDEEMKATRRLEQQEAARIGKYGVLVQLGLSSRTLKDPSRREIVLDLASWIRKAQPEILYTHNPADKHDTHVAVALRVIEAIRLLPKDMRPRVVYGCEVWGDLDWLPDSEKTLLDVSGRPELASRLLEAFPSQNEGGKRYDLATQGRRRANATYLDSHDVDQAAELSYAMDLTPLIQDDNLEVETYVAGFAERFLDALRLRIRSN